MHKVNNNTSTTVNPYDQTGRLWSTVGDSPIEILALDPPKFEEPNEDAMNHFKELGFVVFKKVATSEQLKEAQDLFWEDAKIKYGVEKDKVEDWGNEKWTALAATLTGVVSNDSSAHSPFQWYTRSIPKIKKIFSTIWDTEDLLVSYDGYGVFRPPELYGQTRNGWFHVDQNGYHKQGLHCAQGLLNFFPSGPEDGGLVVVPGSQLKFDSWFSQKLMPAKRRDFVLLANIPEMKELWGRPPVKLCLEPGDFVVWDSRTTHCNHPARCLEGSKPTHLRRLVSYVCMTPSWKAGDLKELRAKREEGHKNGVTLDHWPHEYRPHPTDHNKNGVGRFHYQPQPLNDYQLSLLYGVSDMTKLDR